MWASLIVLLNQKLNRRIGFINPALYSFDQTTEFRDITVGNNGAFSASYGWDPCTGLGTPVGAQLLDALQSTKSNARPRTGKRCQQPSASIDAEAHADPDARARHISNLLVTQIRARLDTIDEGRAHFLAREFLSEGVALGDVEETLERLESNLQACSRLSGRTFPCLKDQDGIMPIDMLGLYFSHGTFRNIGPFEEFLKMGDSFVFSEDFARQAWSNEIEIELMKFPDLLDALEQHLTRFLVIRIGEELAADPPSTSEAGDKADVRPASPAVQPSPQSVLRPGGTVGAAAAGFPTAPKLRKVTVHTAHSGLRIHYTPAYFINWSHVFGSPSSPVAGWLQSGRYKFGGMDSAGSFKFDNATFDFPPLTSAQLVLK